MATPHTLPLQCSMESELGEANVQSSAEEDSSEEEEEEEEEESSSEEEEQQPSKTAESSGSSSAASSSSSEDEQQGDGSPRQHSATPLGTPEDQPATPLAAAQVEDRAERVHGVVGSPLATEEEEEESQFPSTQQLFGADSSGSESSSGESPEAPPMSPEVNKESSARNGGEGETRTVEGLFGDTAELSSSEDERMSTGEGAGLSGEGVGLDDDHLGDAREGQEEVEEEVPRINVEIPRCVANLGSDIHFVKLPNFLSVETRPFDPELYEDEGEEDEILDEEGRGRLKLKVENTIRWRYSTDESGNEIRESNARLVKWSDGTMSLYLGSEIFDIYRQPLQGEFSHLFVRQGTGLQGQAVFRSKLTFRPHSTDSQTHRKMTLSIADRFSKAQKIRVLPAVGKDPESQRLERIKREEENLKAAIRREHHKRRLREKNLQKGGLSASYLEPDRDLESEEDLGAIKSSVRSRLSRRQGDKTAAAAASESSGSESEGESRLIKAKEDQGGRSHGVARRSRKLVSDDEDEDSSD